LIEVEGRIYQEAQNEYEGALTERATIKKGQQAQSTHAGRRTFEALLMREPVIMGNFSSDMKRIGKRKQTLEQKWGTGCSNP
jgi:hypothetical protein